MSRNKIITSMQDLYEHFDSDESFAALNCRIYKDTECGASISVYGTVEGKAVAFHSGHQGPLPEGFKLASFTIQSIVEGSDAEVNSAPFNVGISDTDEITNWISDMEAETSRLWGEANGCEACGGVGYLDTTEDKIERCDACKKFPNDQAAQKAADES